MLAADDCQKKNIKTQKKKRGPPKPKDLKKQTNKKQTHMRNGKDPIVLEAHGIYFSLWSFSERAPLAGWEALFSVFPTSVYISGSSLLGFDFF